MTELAEEKAVESKETLLQFLEDNADPALRPMLSKLANEAEEDLHLRKRPGTLAAGSKQEMLRYINEVVSPAIKPLMEKLAKEQPDDVEAWLRNVLQQDEAEKATSNDVCVLDYRGSAEFT